MSRSISIGYRDATSGANTSIDVRPPYYLLGTQSVSKQFWANPRLREIGIKQLTELGETDPVYFVGWDMMADLWREIRLLQQHVAGIEFDSEIKAQWLAHLTYCYLLVLQSAPKGSIPEFIIG